METMPLTTFLPWLRENWQQGEHMVIVGETGRGKTRLSSQILECRDYVVVIALKRADDTLKSFYDDLLPTIKHRYIVIKKWPPLFSQNHVILWLKPQSLHDIGEQKAYLKQCLNMIYLSGGWTAYFDDAGYASGVLKAAEEMGIMLNQGRSGGLTIVVAMTQPKSVAARVPSETLRQPRHKILFLTTNQVELKACADITGIAARELQYLMRQLKDFDFLYVGKKGTLFHVTQN